MQLPRERSLLYAALVGAVSGAVAAAATSVAMHGVRSAPSAKSPSPVIRAERFEVIGTDGKVHGVLCAQDGAGATLELVGDEPDTKATLICAGKPALELRTGDGVAFYVSIEPGTRKFNFGTVGTEP